MRAVIISHSDLIGGAAIAAYRLHQGLLAEGVESRMLVRVKQSNDDTVVQFEPQNEKNEWLASLTLHVTTKARSGRNNTSFSLPWPGEGIASHPLVIAADVINLHWVAQFVSPEGVRALLALGKPVVWTLHDQRPFTGGCHYTAGCEGFMTNCKACPQLQPDYQAIPEQGLGFSEEALRNMPPLTVVTPSRWLGKEAKRSRLFNRYRVDVIPYGIDLEVFKPGNRTAIRAELSLPSDALVLMFGAYTLSERRKGFDLLASAIQAALADPRIAERHRMGKIIFAAYGKDEATLKKSGLPVRLLGHQEAPAQMARTLCAADLLICPTREDNLPNVVMEAMACGVPVLSCAVGGVPDMITDGEHGRLVPGEDSNALAEALIQIVCDPSPLDQWGRNGRAKCEAAYPLRRQGSNYAALFQAVTAVPAAESVDSGPLAVLQERLLRTLAEAQGRQVVMLKELNEQLTLSAREAAQKAAAKPTAQAALKMVEQLLKQHRSEGIAARFSPTAWALRCVRNVLRNLK